MEEVQMTPAVKKASKRTLEAMQGEDPTIDPEDMGNIKMVAALKQAGMKYVKLAGFKEWKTTICQEEALEEVILLVLKARMPNLDSDSKVAPWLIPPEEVAGDIDKTAFWFVDETCNCMDRLGGRVKRWRTSVRHSRSARLDPPSRAGSALTDAQPPAPPPLASAPAEAMTPPPKAPVPSERDDFGTGCKLLRGSENPAELDKSGTIALCAEAKKLAKAGRFFDPDPCEAQTVEFKVRLYASYVETKAKEAKTMNVPVSNIIFPHMRQFLHYVAEWLLEGDTCGTFMRFHTHFAKMKAVDSTLVPKMAGIMHRMCAADLVGSFTEDAVKFADWGLEPGEMTLLFDSQFYKSWAAARFDATFAYVVSGKEKGTTMASERRVSLVDHLLGKKPTDAQKSTLAFIKTCLTSDGAARMVYLLKAPKGFQQLDEIFPGDSMRCLSALVLDKDRKLPSASSDVDVGSKLASTVAALVKVYQHEEVDEAISNPVMKALVKDYRKFQRVARKGKDETAVVALAMKELVALRMGLTIERGERDVDVHAMEESFLRSIVDVTKNLTTHKKWDPETFKTLAAIFKRCPPTSAEDSPEAPEKGALLALLAGDAPLGAGGRPEEQTVLAPNAEEKKTFASGMEVHVTKANREPKSYVNHRGRVLHVRPPQGDKPGRLTIVMSTGPKKGKNHVCGFDCVSTQDPSCPPAGRPAQGAAAPEDGAAAAANDKGGAAATADEKATQQRDILDAFGGEPPKLG